MCSPNAALIARDPAIPGLAVLFDGPAFAAALREALPNAGILAAQPRYVRYKPGANCTVAYSLTTATGTLPAYARAYAAPLRDKLDHARRLADSPGALGQAACVLAPLDIALYSWPHDHALPALRRITDTRKRRRYIAAVAPEHPALQHAELRTLSYKPERRYVGLLEAANGARAILRLYAPEEYAAAYRAASTTPIQDTVSMTSTSPMTSTPSTSSTLSTSFRTPQLLAADAETSMLLLEWLPGQTLSALLQAHPTDTATIHAAGAAVAALHQSAPPDLPQNDPLNELASAVAAISAIEPAETQRAEQVATAIVATLHAVDPPRRLIHGDLYADQMLVDNDMLALIDLDNLALGDPAADLGAWIAQRHSTGTAPEIIQRHEIAFLAGYTAAGGSASGVEAHVAAHLLRRAAEPFRYCAPDWPAQLRRLLDCAEEYLRHATLTV